MNHKHKTPLLTKEQAVKETNWYLLDASGQILGRFASEVAKILMGKHKTSYTRHVDTGDGVIVVNADKVIVTGNKEAQKIYKSYSGFMGGLKETPYRDMKAEEIIENAVKGMMPKNKMSRKQLTKLRIYLDDKHEMQAQKPINVK